MEALLTETQPKAGSSPAWRRASAPFALFTCLAASAYAQQGGAARALAYDAQTRGPVPIPPSERGLQTVVAKPWFKVSDEGIVLEGPAFDRSGDLLFCDVSGRRVLRLTADKRLSTIVSLNDVGPGGVAIHEDGRIFIAAMNLITGTGLIVAVKPDGTGMQTIVPAAARLYAERSGVRRQGRLLLYRFPGHFDRSEGRRQYVSPDLKSITRCCRMSPWPTGSR